MFKTNCYTMYNQAKAYFRSLCLIMAFGLACSTAMAQAPANDDCAGAITLPVNATTVCAVNGSGTTLNATQSTAPAPSCVATGTNDDVWFKFVASASTHLITLSNVQGGVSDMAQAVYGGSCGALTQLACSDPNVMIVSGLTAGQTYYVRVWTATATAGSSASFDICVTTPAAAPANDNCAGAATLSVSPTTTCATSVSGTTISATAGAGDPASSCQGAGTNDDVWYKFVATQPYATVSLSNVTGSSSDMAMGLFSGSCGSLTELYCSDPNSFTYTGLTVGQTYYIRVWTIATGVTANANFDICVTTPPAPPANDNCNGAVSLPVSSATTCASTTSGNTANATQSSTPAPACSATGINDDVWFSFVATGSAQIVSISSVTPTANGVSYAVYSGTCNNLTELGCFTTASNTVGSLVAGQTYYVRVWTTSSTAGTTATFGICIATPPPPPANDECAAAVNVPVSSTLTCASPVAGTTVAATGSTGVPTPGCSATGANDDVWYSFVATGSQHVVMLTGATSLLSIEVYSGACGSLSAIDCFSGTATATLTRYLTGLTAGQTYRVRIYTSSATATTTSPFNICIGTPPPPPANDDCAGALTVPVNADLNCTQQVAGTTVSATQSTQAAPTCGATGINDDVWFKFVATNRMHIISLNNVTGSVTDMVMAVYSGSCTAPTQIVCSDPNSVTVQNLTPGQTYYVRVWTYVATNGSTANFNICVSTPPAPPANDECAGAVSLTASTTGTCGTTTTGTTTWATMSGVAAPSCNATGIDDDVWYSFVATSPYHRIQTTMTSGNGISYAVYSGTCGSLTEVTCKPGGGIGTVNGLTVGQRYYVRVYSSSGTYANAGSVFTICVNTPPPPPSNDEVCNATMLTVSQTSECNYVTYTNQTASGSNVPDPGCASYAGGDVWFKVIVPCQGKLRIDTQTGGITDGGMAIYSGRCNNLTLISCDDDSSPNGAMPQLNPDNLTPGDTLYIRFWAFGNSQVGTFGICTTVPANVGAISVPGSPVCSTSVPLCSQSAILTQSVTGVTSGGTIGCLYTTPNPQYYYLNISQAGQLHFTITQNSVANNTPIDVDYALFGPFTSTTQACGGITEANIVSCSYSGSGTEPVNLQTVSAGQIYVLLVTNYANQPAVTTITPYTTALGNGTTIAGFPQGTPGPTTAQTSGANCVTATNNGPICPGGTVNLTSNAFPNGSYSWTGPNCWTSNQQNPTNVPVPAVPGNYVYYLQVTTPSGTFVGSTVVTVMPFPDLGRDTTVRACAGNPRINLPQYLNQTNVQLTWTLNGNPVHRPDSVWYSGNFMAIGTSATGCKDTAFVRVIIDTVRSTAVVVQPNCSGRGSITLTPAQGMPPYTYNINTQPGVYQTGNVFTNLIAGQYTISTKDSMGCIGTQTVILRDTNNLNVRTINDTLLCNNQSLTLRTTSNATSFVWTPATGLSSTTSQNPVFTAPAASGTYTYVVTATLGTCTAKDTVVIRVDPGLTVSAGPDLVLLAGDQGVLTGSVTGTPTSIVWSPIANLSDPNSLTPTVSTINPVWPTSTPGTPTIRTYTLTVKNAIGCSTSDSALVTVIPNCVTPKNAFSPNGDGINDLWVVYDSRICLTNVEAHIYNRYGALVYENRNYTNNFDGRYKGKPVPDGTYYAVLNYTLINGKTIQVKTDVNILR